MRVVVDTNVFVAALLSDATPRRVYEAFLSGTITLLFSRQTLFELVMVLQRPSIRLITSRPEADRLLADVQRDGRLVETTERVFACRDPKDNRFLECALAGHADYLVTGDLDLLVLHPFRGIPILRPAEFLRRLSTC